MNSIWIGFDPRAGETQAFAVARQSIKRRLSEWLPVRGLNLNVLRHHGLYTRPTELRDGRLWDLISGAPMSTEFAISRFLVPHLAKHGLALFVDAGVMARADLIELFKSADRSKVCSVVKHDYAPKGTTKMTGEVQTTYHRKNWSSVVLWNCDHPKARMCSVAHINNMRGLWLHQFKWLDDDDIGDLDPAWNHLVGDNKPNPKAKLVHFTNGTPGMAGHDGCEYAAEWWAELEGWAA